MKYADAPGRPLRGQLRRRALPPLGQRQTLYNPFVGNLLMDAFTTEIGAEAYLRGSGLLAMVGSDRRRGQGPGASAEGPRAGYLAKLGLRPPALVDALRVRLTGSLYTNDQVARATRCTRRPRGSRYYSVLENTTSTESGAGVVGAIQPGFKNTVTAFVINPFVKIGGLELFGNIEQAKGARSARPQRTWASTRAKALYRFANDQLYVGGRYNRRRVSSPGSRTTSRSSALQLGGGWFVTPNLLTKAECVRQKYIDFPTSDIRNGGQFRASWSKASSPSDTPL